MAKKRWRLLREETYTGFTNMAIDECIIRAFKENKTDPTLRFYTWNPPTVTIGYFQKLEEEIDQEACLAQNVDVVRRLTGGRAVLHEHELTYSILTPEEELGYTGIIPSYKFISEGLVKGLELTGIKTDELSRGEKIGRDNLMAACFNAHSWYEITINGKKVVGSAQTRKDGILLQHGSILTHFSGERLYQFLKTKDQREKEKLIKFAERKATGIENEYDFKVNLRELEENLIKALREHFDVEFYEDGLNSAEKAYLQELEEKYASQQWNHLY